MSTALRLTALNGRINSFELGRMVPDSGISTAGFSSAAVNDLLKSVPSLAPSKLLTAPETVNVNGPSSGFS